MPVYLSPPVSFSHIGQRPQQQDTLFPAVGEASPDSTLFMACDGMGGADRGDVASRLLCDSVVGYAESMGWPVLDSAHLRAALDLVYKAYLTFLKQNPLVNRMGSTLALLQFHERGATVAHIGDSRVYQVRAGTVIFQTKDHRQVNDMVEAGIITAVQAKTHPWRNRLSRAVTIQASHGTSTQATAEIACLTDIQRGDYFFICTDGVQEQIDEQTLGAILTEDLSDVEKADLLLTRCRENTKDNYSAHLIGVSHASAAEPVASAGTGPRYVH